MSGLWRAAWIVLIFWLAAALQQAGADSLTLWGMRPDFLLVLCTSASLIVGPGVAARYGFAAGLIYGALAGANLTHYVISRTVASFLIAQSGRFEFQVGLWSAGIIVGLGTLLAQLLLMLLAPPPDIWPFLRATMGTATYNGVLAVPIYALLRRILLPKVV